MSDPSHWAWFVIAIVGFIVIITWLVVLVRVPRPPAPGQRWSPRDRRRALFLALGMCATLLPFFAVAAQRSLLQMRADAIASMTPRGRPFTEKTERIGPFVTRYSLFTTARNTPGGDVALHTYDIGLGPPDYTAPFIGCAFWLGIAWAIRGVAALIHRRHRAKSAATANH